MLFQQLLKITYISVGRISGIKYLHNSSSDDTKTTLLVVFSSNLKQKLGVTMFFFIRYGSLPSSNHRPTARE